MDVGWLEWRWLSFGELSNEALYEVLRLRQEVFALEQTCLYQDMDSLDQFAYHLCGYQQQKLIAYCRVIEPGKKFIEASVGRVLTCQDVRGSGIGKQLLDEAINRTRQQYSGTSIRISAQLYLQAFYQQADFATVGEAYQEDGIPHIEMLLN